MRERRYGRLIGLRRCIRSHPCSLACKAEYEVPLGCHCSCPGYETRNGHISPGFLH
ncbi:MAG: hypothetical protein ABSB32_19560 [Thermodesulfobacteriota bacterium]|jgi:Fe-S-cluster-containing dehydrogenase component